MANDLKKIIIICVFLLYKLIKPFAQNWPHDQLAFQSFKKFLNFWKIMLFWEKVKKNLGEFELEV